MFIILFWGLILDSILDDSIYIEQKIGIIFDFMAVLRCLLNIYTRKYSTKLNKIFLLDKQQNCHFWELKEELKRTEKNLKELKLSK